VIEIDVDVADLAQVRFTTDAVWETAASLHAVVFSKHHLLHQRIRRLVPKQPDFDLDHLLTMVGDGAWLPDILAPTPSQRPAQPLQQIAALRETDPAVVDADLALLRVHAPGSRTARMCPEEYVETTVTALTAWWLTVLQPLWDRVDAIVRADIAHHQAVVGAEGLAAAMPVLHHDLSFDGHHLRVDLARTEASTRAAGAGVWLVPSVFRWPWVACDIREGSTVVSYGARGSGRVWNQPGREAQQGLGDLIGRTRATILERLDVPYSTTALSRMLGLSLSTVSEHLTVMTASGLLQSRRDGQRVLYWRTMVGDLLVNGEPASGRRSG